MSHLVALYLGQSGWAGTGIRHSFTHSLFLWVLHYIFNVLHLLCSIAFALCSSQISLFLQPQSMFSSRAGFSWWGACGPGPLPPSPLNSALVSGPESHRVNYALQYITGTTSDFSFQYRSTGISGLLNLKKNSDQQSTISKSSYHTQSRTHISWTKKKY